ncbi:hypothetical protein BJ508DRAFT_23850 [Ascobolus immersus RN42]|uniref:Uncharacterized protein n=1 Tax=Ascobolus immersus RN42 TaxID=1160509 RepID=A0A3N4HN45_ASCIM|nr:hypothetical protein BJ508DRAFT_23850 [Ascobolus immersus RN42]
MSTSECDLPAPALDPYDAFIKKTFDGLPAEKEKRRAVRYLQEALAEFLYFNDETMFNGFMVAELRFDLSDVYPPPKDLPEEHELGEYTKHTRLLGRLGLDDVIRNDVRASLSLGPTAVPADCQSETGGPCPHIPTDFFFLDPLEHFSAEELGQFRTSKIAKYLKDEEKLSVDSQHSYPDFISTGSGVFLLFDFASSAAPRSVEILSTKAYVVDGTVNHDIDQITTGSVEALTKQTITYSNSIIAMLWLRFIPLLSTTNSPNCDEKGHSGYERLSRIILTEPETESPRLSWRWWLVEQEIDRVTMESGAHEENIEECQLYQTLQEDKFYPQERMELSILVFRGAFKAFARWMRVRAVVDARIRVLAKQRKYLEVMEVIRGHVTNDSEYSDNIERILFFLGFIQFLDRHRSPSVDERILRHLYGHPREQL